MTATERAHVLAWMQNYAEDHVDPKTGELNYTGLVEDWDNCCSTGDATLDPDHPAWEIALLVAE